MNTIDTRYTARVRGQTVEADSLPGAVRAVADRIGVEFGSLHTRQQGDAWLVFADYRDRTACARVTLSCAKWWLTIEAAP